MYVLEDNLRVPSGVSYVLENRAISKRVFADLFARQSILPVDSYTDELNRMLVSIAPDGVANPTVAVLTPGIYNSAYFEHSFLAQRMGAALVEGADLVVADDDCVYMRTIGGRERVHVIYRRIDDLFLDPEVFRPDSTLGVPGLMRAWRAGTVAIANAPGAGVADDKVVYAWVPDIIRYYTGAEPIIPNVPTYRCVYPDEMNYVIEHIDELVVKPANESGGYGLLIGDRATRSELDAHIALDRGRSAQLGRPADPVVVDGADAVRRRDRTASRRPAAVHPQRRDQLRQRRRADPRRAAQGLADRQLVAGWRQQGHLDRRGGLMLLSRVADSLYWGARYLERAAGHGSHRAQLHRTGHRPSDQRPVVVGAVARRHRAPEWTSTPGTTLSTRCRSFVILVADTRQPQQRHQHAWPTRARTCARRARCCRARRGRR